MGFNYDLVESGNKALQVELSRRQYIGRVNQRAGNRVNVGLVCAVGVDVENVVHGVGVAFQFGVVGVDGGDAAFSHILVCAQVDVEVLIEAEVAVQVVGVVGQEAGGVVTCGDQWRFGCEVVVSVFGVYEFRSFGSCGFLGGFGVGIVVLSQFNTACVENDCRPDFCSFACYIVITPCDAVVVILGFAVSRIVKFYF